jgi:hypothetical protein
MWPTQACLVRSTKFCYCEENALTQEWQTRIVTNNTVSGMLAETIMLLTCMRGVIGSNLGRGSGYNNWYYSWFSIITPRKCRYSTSYSVMPSLFHTLSNSTLTYQIIRRHKYLELLITSPTKPSPPSEDTSRSATKEFPKVLWKPNIHNRVPKSPSVVPISSQLKRIHTTPSCSSKANLIFSRIRGPLTNNNGF